MVWISTSLLAVSFPLWWALTGYFRQLPTESLSFVGQDGWCNPATEGVGIHCFGDFQLPRQLLDAPSVWNDPGGFAVGYTPVGLLPNVAAKGLEDIGFGIRGSLIVFLVAMGIAMAVPAVLTTVRGAPGTRGPLSLLLFFAAAAPILITLDRGNSVGFAIPFLLVFAIYAGRDPRWVAPLAIVAAAGVRPQFVLIAIGLIAFRRTKDALAAVGGAVALTALSFLVWPGNPADNLHAWWTDITAYGTGASSDKAVTNLSASRSLHVLGEILDRGPAFLGAIGRSIQDFTLTYPAVPGVALLLACSAAFALRRGSIPRAIVIAISLAMPALVPSLSFGYYLGFSVVIAVMICGPAAPVDLLRGGRATGGLLENFDSRRALHRAWSWLLVITTALSIAPLIVRTTDIGYTPFLGSVGLLWLILCIAPLTWGATGLIARHVNYSGSASPDASPPTHT